METDSSVHSEWLTGRVHQATGAVIYSARVAPMDALKLLYAHAAATGLDIDDVAELVLRRKLTIVGPPTAAITTAAATIRRDAASPSEELGDILTKRAGSNTP